MRALLALAAIVSVGAWVSSAAAYCRTAVCGEEVGKVCDPPEPTDCGTPIYWPTTCVGFSVQRDASSDVSLRTRAS